MKRVIAGARVITPMRIIPEGGVAFENGVITQIFEGKPGDLTRDAIVWDAGGRYVSPGFIDTHVHGGGGYDFMDAVPEDVVGACKAHMRYGTTTILPSTTACSPQELRAALLAIRAAMRDMKDGPNLPGVHLEGSYFNLAQAGAQNPEFIVDPNPEEYLPWMEEFPEILRWSAAPELPGGLELGRELKKRGILGSIAHSDAVWTQIREAFENGYTHMTHLYSGMSMTRRINAYRYGGVVEAAYLIDGMSVELIADGKHLPEELLRLAIKIKGYDQVMLVTDAMKMAGTDALEGSLGAKKHATKCIIEDGVAKMPDRQAFAGSIATTDRLVRTMVNLAEVPLREAVRMMTLTPATIMGFTSKGALAAGMDADIVVFGENVDVQAVIVGGELRVNSLNWQKN